MALLGDASGSINLLPGEYLGQTLYLPNRPHAGDASILVQPADGRNSAKIVYSGSSSFVVGISAAHVTLMDLRFFTSAAAVVQAEMSASHLTIRNCFFDQSSGPEEGAVAIRIGGNLAPVLDHVVISSNTFIGPSRAAIQVANPVDMLHVIHNTAHLPGTAHGLLVEAGSYSGIVVDNNIFNYLGYTGGRTILEFASKGKGTKINLNCVSSVSGSPGAILARKASTHSVEDLQLSFRSLDPGDPNPGASLRGTCFDIYAQEKLSVLRKP